MPFRVWMIIIWCCFSRSVGKETTREYCGFEMFDPSCAADEVLIMRSAQFGQMRLGRCLEVDLGFLGCGVDVMYILDERCSGKQSCEILVGDQIMSERSTCTKGLLQYLEADYKCAKAHLLEKNTCNQAVISSAEELIISDRVFEHNCAQANRPWQVRANRGQRMNISLIDFQHVKADQHEDKVYGKLIDTQTGREVPLRGESRYHELILSSSHEVEVVFYSSSNRFALDVKVLGCTDMSPPDGAWMTRDGDVMEVGCHSGVKSWTIRCHNNQWIGGVGYCGGAAKDEKPKPKQARSNISLNVIVFGACSVVLLISTIIFLCGVLLLKRKPISGYNYTNKELISTKPPPPYNLQSAKYPHTLQRAPISHNANEPHFGVSTMPSRQAAQLYENGSDHYKSLKASDTRFAEKDLEGSVQYFVLEESTAKQSMLNN